MAKREKRCLVFRLLDEVRSHVPFLSRASGLFLRIRKNQSRGVHTTLGHFKPMGETAKEKNEASTEVEKKEENHEKNEEKSSKDDKIKKKKKDKNGEGEEDKEGGEKKEKKKKNPEDKNDPAKLKLKLEKLDAKMQALAIKKEEILNMIKEAEKNGTASGVSATADASKDATK
ncbi:hypothetical protein FRX31_032104 [Thalictrum thalictroides]|uniref:Uncharacterized protein n=1 Tax=Thalictrum thalictroides TaxID=46969 RepID=A0A7J6V052_THATH|nr:hypothetical protein FRX31_032104 [Thalictrum thalictroides]